MSRKPNYMILTTIAFMSALILAFMPQPRHVITTQTDPSLLANEIVNKNAMIHPDILAKWMIDGKPDLMVIDVRSPEDFEKYHLPGAVNYPVKALLEKEKENINSDMVTVFTSNGDNEASQVWLLLRMMGYNNIYVLQGGVNFWVANYVSPQKPGENSPDTEIFKFQFRKSAAGHFNGGISLEENATAKKSIKPMFIPEKKSKKKQAREGC